jgi:hypothetical protein
MRTRIKSRKVCSSTDFSVEVLKVEGKSKPLSKRLSKEELNRLAYSKQLRSWIEFSNKFKPEWAKVSHKEWVADKIANNVINSMAFIQASKSCGVFAN